MTVLLRPPESEVLAPWESADYVAPAPDERHDHFDASPGANDRRSGPPSPSSWWPPGSSPHSGCQSKHGRPARRSWCQRLSQQWVRSPEAGARAFFRLQFPIATTLPQSVTLWVEGFQQVTTFVDGTKVALAATVPNVLVDTAPDVPKGVQTIDIRPNLTPGINAVGLEVASLDGQAPAFRARVEVRTGTQVQDFGISPSSWESTTNAALTGQVLPASGVFSRSKFDDGNWVPGVTSSPRPGTATSVLPPDAFTRPADAPALTGSFGARSLIASTVVNFPAGCTEGWMRVAATGTYTVSLDGRNIASGNAGTSPTSLPLSIFDLCPVASAGRHILTISVGASQRPVGLRRWVSAVGVTRGLVRHRAGMARRNDGCSTGHSRSHRHDELPRIRHRIVVPAGPGVDHRTQRAVVRRPSTLALRVAPRRPHRSHGRNRLRCRPDGRGDCRALWIVARRGLGPLADGNPSHRLRATTIPEHAEHVGPGAGRRGTRRDRGRCRHHSEPATVLETWPGSIDPGSGQARHRRKGWLRASWYKVSVVVIATGVGIGAELSHHVQPPVAGRTVQLGRGPGHSCPPRP